MVGAEAPDATILACVLVVAAASEHFTRRTVELPVVEVGSVVIIVIPLR